MTDRELQDMADLYGLYTEEDVRTLNERNADLQKRLDIAQGILDRDTEYDELKNNLEKAKSLLARWIDTRPYTVSEQKDLIADTEQFLCEVER